ncbi:MAG: hypothetical protein ACLFTT_03085 [Candidatus Hydrogenedentota bacterium]
MDKTPPPAGQAMPCTTCRLRARYEKNPRSLRGRFWRWHTRWCPGWKKYLRSLPEAERDALIDRLNLMRTR